jgi:hypothetical protein
MSIRVMTDVWAHADCSGSELLVLLALADFSDDHGENIYPSMQTLARKSRLSESQARRVVQNLVKKGLLEIVEAGGWDRGRNRSNAYRILLENLNTEGGVNLKGGSKLTPPPSRPRAHRGSTDAPGVVASALDDPSYDPLPKPPLKEMRPPRAQSQKKGSFRAPPDIDPLTH